MNLIQNLENIIKEENLLKRGDSFVIGVSGGVDSVTLLYSLNQLKKNWNFKIYVAHLNHGLRRKASFDEDFVKTLANKYKLPFFSKKVKLPRTNIEEAGRKERYNFFKEIKENTKAKYIITAHNLNDNVETILLNLTRGAGLAGLSGMRLRLKEGDLIRPFLKFTRKEIVKFATKNKLKWREDPSNKQLKFSRNRLRLKVIPELLKINEKVNENILRSAQILNEAQEFFDLQAEKFLKDNLKKDEGLTLNLKKFYPLEKFLQKEILKKILSQKIKNIEKIYLEDILLLIKKPGTKELHLPSGLIVLKEYDNLTFSSEKKEVAQKAKIPLPENTEVHFQGFKISATKEEKVGEASNSSIFIDFQKTGNLFVRTRKEGDKIYLSKTGQRKKLKDLFIEKKVPKKNRNIYPIIVNEKDEIVWVPFLRQDERFRAEKSKKAIKLEAKYDT